jgi:hypothetical protein
MNPDDLAAALASVPQNLLKKMGDSCMQYETAEDFVAAMLCGSCPKCGSKKTEDFADHEEYLDPFLGRCKECCALFCIECGSLYKDDESPASYPTVCPACGSKNTDLPKDEDEDSSASNPEINCFDCGAAFCFHCGTVSAD